MISDSKDTVFREFRGLSTETKPKGEVLNGAQYLEIDTGKIFIYDAENEQWVEF